MAIRVTDRSAPERTKPAAPAADSGGHENIFLSPPWFGQLVEALRASRKSDAAFYRLTKGLSLSLGQVVTRLPRKLSDFYQGAGRLAAVFHVRKGEVSEFEISAGAISGADYVISVDYDVARRILLGELSPTSSFFSGRLTLQPLSTFRGDVRLAGSSVMLGSAVLKIARKLPTIFP